MKRTLPACMTKQLASSKQLFKTLNSPESLPLTLALPGMPKPAQMAAFQTDASTKPNMEELFGFKRLYGASRRHDATDKCFNVIRVIHVSIRLRQQCRKRTKLFIDQLEKITEQQTVQKMLHATSMVVPSLRMAKRSVSLW